MTPVTAPSVMLAAGGTGGHLFPAFALAQELGRRVHPRRPRDRHARRPLRHRFPGARRLSRSVRHLRRARDPGGGTDGLDADARRRRVVQAAGQGQARRRGGLRRLSGFSAARRRPAAPHPDRRCTSRTPCSAAPTACSPTRVTAIATSFEHTKHLEGPRARQSRAHRQSGARSGDRLGDAELSAARIAADRSRCWCSAAARARASSPTRCRRRWRCCRTRSRASLFVVQQCREEDLARVEAAYEAAGVRAHLATFFANLPEEMAKAHLVIGRAGASTVAELTVMGRPAILVPLPHAIDNDQLQNATPACRIGRRLVHRAEGADAGAAWPAPSAACWRRPRR